MKTNQDLFKLLYGMYHTGVPVMVFGNAGIGKTSIIKQLGRVLNVTTVTKSSSKVTDVDLTGIPYLVDVLDNGKEVNPADVVNVRCHKEVRISVPTYVKQLNNDPNGILFFDELSTASIDVQKQMLSLIQDCELNDFTIPKSTFRVAAGNYSNIQGNKPLSRALLNRFCHIHAQANIDAMINGFVSGFNNYEVCKLNSKDEAEHKLIQYKILVTDFWKAYPQYLDNMPEDIVSEEDQGFPSPRAWENACKILSVLDCNDDEYIETLICGVLGDGPGKLFLTYKNSNELFDIDIREWVGKESTVTLPHPDDMHEVYQITSSVVAYFEKDCKKYLDLWARIINLLHNKDNKYGKYTPYDNIIKTFMTSSTIILNKYSSEHEPELISKKIKEWAGNAPGTPIEDWNDLYSLSAQATSR